MKIFIINDLNDILAKRITHFSLDKGLYLGYGLAENNCTVYFLTLGKSIQEKKINFVNINDANTDFLNDMDLIIIVREALVPNLLENYNVLKEFILKEKKKPKILIKSDSIQWIIDKKFRKYISEQFKVKPITKYIIDWVCKHIDYICVQTEEFKKDALSNRVPENKLIVLNMAVSQEKINYEELKNPYTINHEYCTTNYKELKNDLALLPLYYCNNREEIKEFNKEKKIIVYTGRIKTDQGKILFLMKEIMNKLDDYELHIFPGSFILPNIEQKTFMKCSASNSFHLNLLREKIFYDSKNIIIHYPYEHKNMHKYLYYAYCGIDFSDIRPKQDEICKAGHAKILEYCLMGLPVVCEEKINNIFLINNGKNGIILPYMASVDEYVEAIKKIGETEIDREYCRNITYQNENCIKRAKELLDLINK